MTRRADARMNTATTPVPLTDQSPHAVVIGAGFGGLAGAIRLLARGYRVTVVDRLDQPGGRARVFRETTDAGTYTFDAGPTLITAPFLFDELWALNGERREDHVDFVPITPFYRIRFDDQSPGGSRVFDYTGDPDQMRHQIARFNPDDVKGYERFLEKSEEIFEVGFTNLGHVPFGRMGDMTKIIPAMVALQSHRTVYGFVQKYIKDPQLRQVFSFHPLLVGGNPFSTTSIYALIAFLERKWGVWYAMGGTGAIVKGMTDLVERMGGTIRLNTDVEEITADARAGPEVAGNGRAAGGRRAPAGRGRRLQRRRRVDLPPPRRHGAPKPLDR